jgi:hypothetical protein
MLPRVHIDSRLEMTTCGHATPGGQQGKTYLIVN